MWFLAQRQPKAVVAAAVLLCAVFFALGYAFIQMVGLQEDEVQFVAGILPPLVGRRFVQIGGELYPLMIATYAGALKALAYLGIFSIWPPGTLSLRIPMLLAGTATVYLFFVFFRKAMGDLAALIATALLVFDPVFVTHTVLDSGIVTVQHLLMAAALPLFLQYHRTRRKALLGAACFLCGLALWDKATFVWLIAGWGAGLAAVYWREMRTHLNLGRLGLALFCVLLGALPVVYYTLTERQTAGQGMGGFGAPTRQKAIILMKTLDGSSPFGFLIRNPDLDTQRAPRTGLERASVWLAGAVRHPWHHWLLWASLAAALLIPFLKPGPERRIMVFSVVAFAAGWLLMLPFAMGGEGSHHIILLWPLPQMLVASAVCALRALIPRLRAVVAIGLAAPVVLSCALVTNECYAQLVLFGPTDHWSDAVYPLLDWLRKAQPASIYPLDWGIEGPLRCLGQGALPLQKDVSDMLSQPLPPANRRETIRSMLAQPRRLFIFYTDRSRHANANLERLRTLGSEAGLIEKCVTLVRDRNNRPVYSVVRYVDSATH
jgi:hypothetical protein